jgi:hypothetical protein
VFLTEGLLFLLLFLLVLVLLVLLLQSVGPAETHLAHCSLSRLIVHSPAFSSPFISRGASSQNGVRDLY